MVVGCRFGFQEFHFDGYKVKAALNLELAIAVAWYFGCWNRYHMPTKDPERALHYFPFAMHGLEMDRYQLALPRGPALAHYHL